MVLRPDAPCIAWNREARHCLVGLLHGVGCCPHGDCALCEEQQQRMRRMGCPEIAVARSWLRSRLPRIDACPVCGFPPPPPMRTIPPLPRLDRSDRILSGSPTCKVCGCFIRPPKRFYCSAECWLEHRATKEGWRTAGVRRSPLPAPRYGRAP